MSETNVLSPPISLPDLFPVHPRPLLPLRSPPAHRWLYPPVLPSPAREPAPKLLRELYELSTHIVPAAYPRSTPYVPAPTKTVLDPGAPQSREERKAEVSRIATELIQAGRKNAELPTHAGDRDLRLLWNVANRYLRKGVRGKDLGGRKRLTLLFFHANGFPKEIWEPTIAHVLEELRWRSSEEINIDEIWSLEAVQHGDAALINGEKLGSLYTWADNTRDILNFLLYYLPDASSYTYSTHLPFLPKLETETRVKKGFLNREIIAVGHSFGACSAALAAINYPKLFEALVLVDPVILVPKADTRDFVEPLVVGAVQRREEWPSLDEARKSFEASPFFKAWDPSVLDVYLECGLTEANDGNGAVRLKMPGIQEAVVFIEPRVSFEVFDLLNTLDDRVQLHWVLGGRQPYFDGDGEARHIRVWRRPANCSNVEIMSAGHLVAQEAPRELALEICKVLRQRYSRESVSAGDGGKARL